MVNTPGAKKSKAIKILGERAGARLRDNFKNPCITPPLITILRQVMKWRL